MHGGLHILAKSLMLISLPTDTDELVLTAIWPSWAIFFTLLALYFISYAYNDPIRERFLFTFSREFPEAYRGKIILPQDTQFICCGGEILKK